MKQKSFSGITILGLGPGDSGHLTRQVWDWLNAIQEIYVRTDEHPSVKDFPVGLTVHSFDSLYQQADSFEKVYDEIVEQIISLGHLPQGVTYGVPGHPYIAEATTPAIVQRAEDAGIPVQVMEGLSFIEPTCTALGLDPFPYLVLVDALELSVLHHPAFSPAHPAIIAQIYSRQVASEVKLSLNAVYPDEHPVQLVHAAGTPDQLVERLALFEIDRSMHIGISTVLYLPLLEKDVSLEGFQEVVARLRAPDGCPWDREQTHESLRSHLLEETYETLSSIDAGDMESLCEELGDLLLQIVLHSQIASEDGDFSMTDILAGINRKIVHRHPHVFGDLKVDGVENILQNWDKLKAEEREVNGVAEDIGRLDGVPEMLPALSQAQEIQERAARAGFDWPEIAPVLKKVFEELDEVQEQNDPEKKARELGDLLFAVVNLARWYKTDAESVLRETNLRFRRRFRHIETRSREQGRQLSSMSLAEMDELWEEAKEKEE
jgi:tetrapyrrole methylase family protein / MazG family protein